MSFSNPYINLPTIGARKPLQHPHHTIISPHRNEMPKLNTPPRIALSQKTIIILCTVIPVAVLFAVVMGIVHCALKRKRQKQARMRPDAETGAEPTLPDVPVPQAPRRFETVDVVAAKQIYDHENMRTIYLG
ncbi:hypothetical protein BDV95DRAFT_608002 [Massariosphaeria phaeospora]|uniref:Uncharacterized protein n=1 Tax=Massariosphaeria phaeospora TaxID=100035 RepID=A0A7C8IE52_9PLEO|nr:hypothetical protein BDV95DRAFT_608002 [Massariosphaeria phaeospora]